MPLAQSSIRRLFAAAALGWFIVVAVLAAWSWHREMELVRELARLEGEMAIDTDYRYRQWATLHGGVYAPPSEKWPPNPYLGHVSERDITTPSGRRLTLVNPAYMTRQVHEMQGGPSTRVHITSLNPLNPINRADDWDAQALRRLEAGAVEVAEVVDFKGEPAMRILRPMLTEDGCLKCHEHQGYKVGDLRGGLGVVVKLTPYLTAAAQNERQGLVGYVLLLLVGFMPIGVGERVMRRRAEERDRMTQELWASEERYQVVADFTADWEYWRDETGRMVYVSPSCKEVTGYTREELMGDPELLLRIAHPEDQVFLDHLVNEHSTDAPIELRIIRKDGQVRWIQHVCREVRTSEGRSRGRRASNRDITEARMKSDRLRESEQRLRESQRVSRVGSYVIDAETSNWTSSEILDEIFGIGPEYPRTLTSWLQLVHPEARDQITAQLLGEVLPKRLPLDREYPISRFNDGQIRQVHARGLWEADADGRALRLCGTVQDMTERKQLEQQLFQAQKMEAVGQLAGGVAHDFNNILAVVLMQTALLQADEKDLSPSLREGLADIESAARRAADLTRQLLLFGRRQMMHPQVLDLNVLLANLLKMLRRIIGETIELEWKREQRPLWIEADPGMIEQVVLNLCVNARDAMPRGGCLVLATRAVGAPAEGVGGDAELAVADTGFGMDAHTRQHLFEPFFTTKEQGKGTGLGLAIVHGIVQQHRGSIEVESVSGRGSTFRIRIPLTQAVARTGAVGAHSEQPLGTEVVLLVEDEASLRHAIAGWLRRLGYQVTEAGSGDEAMLAWERADGSFDLVLTDMMMPGELNGLELIQRLRSRRKELRAILMSGYSVEIAGNRPPEDLGILFVAKPFEVSVLGRTVRACLDAQAPLS